MRNPSPVPAAHCSRAVTFYAGMSVSRIIRPMRIHICKFWIILNLRPVLKLVRNLKL